MTSDQWSASRCRRRPRRRVCVYVSISAQGFSPTIISGHWTSRTLQNVVRSSWCDRRSSVALSVLLDGCIHIWLSCLLTNADFSISRMKSRSYCHFPTGGPARFFQVFQVFDVSNSGPHVHA
jgi:hypothetical protein